MTVNLLGSAAFCVLVYRTLGLYAFACPVFSALFWVRKQSTMDVGVLKLSILHLASYSSRLVQYARSVYDECILVLYVLFIIPTNTRLRACERMDRVREECDERDVWVEHNTLVILVP